MVIVTLLLRSEIRLKTVAIVSKIFVYVENCLGSSTGVLVLKADRVVAAQIGICFVGLQKTSFVERKSGGLNHFALIFLGFKPRVL